MYMLSLWVYFEIDGGIHLLNTSIFCLVDKKFIYILGFTVRRDTIFYRLFYVKETGFIWDFCIAGFLCARECGNVMKVLLSWAWNVVKKWENLFDIFGDIWVTLRYNFCQKNYSMFYLTLWIRFSVLSFPLLWLW